MNRNDYVTLTVYDLLAKKVVKLVNEVQNPGEYKIEFDAAKYNLSSGLYFYRLQAGEFSKTMKMMLLK